MGNKYLDFFKSYFCRFQGKRSPQMPPMPPMPPGVPSPPGMLNPEMAMSLSRF
jgi:hypothetical protein